MNVNKKKPRDVFSYLIAEVICPALVSLVGQDVQEQLQSLLILETLSDVEGAEHHHSPAGNEGLATLLTANYGGQNLVSVVYEHCVVLK